MKKHVASFLLITCSITASAVDGYKNLKFGSSVKEVQNSKICSFAPLTDYGNGVKALECTNFKFGNDNVEAAALFINDKFLRFVIVADLDYTEAIAKQLKSKYGTPSSMSPQSDLDSVDRYPNRTAFIAFDNNTIYMKVDSDNNNNESLLIIYTSPAYENLLLKNQHQSISNDL
ncbi:MAG: hypothetical protein EOM50_17760 [Erysipelotrichia bacterium]|nr:hypothetical protein [Erysipelotrichia bacterium]